MSPRTKPLQIEDEVLVEERRSLSRVRSWVAGRDADKPARAMPELNQFPATLSGMPRFGRIDRFIVEDSLRTAVAGVASFLIARVLTMPEAYWATFSALIVTQSSLGAAATISRQRIAGTLLGASLGALLAQFFHSNLIAFGMGVFVLGLVCALLRLGVAYRFAAVTLTLIMLIPRNHAAWIVAGHRLVEVSVGIAVGLACSAIWPKATFLHRQEAASEQE